MDSNTIFSFIEASGLGVFLYFIFKGLSSKISLLEDKAKIQIETLKIMERRIEETEKIGNIYKKLIEDIPSDIDNYKTFISRTRDDIIIELKDQNNEIKGKLLKAESVIKGSSSNEEHIKRYLHSLAKLVSQQNDENDNEYLLKDICEHENRKLEESIVFLVDEDTLEKFLGKLRFSLIITEDRNIAKKVMTDLDDRILPNGEKARGAKINFGTNEWSMIVNNCFFVNSLMLNRIKDEFSSIKT